MEQNGKPILDLDSFIPLIADDTVLFSSDHEKREMPEKVSEKLKDGSDNYIRKVSLSAGFSCGGVSFYLSGKADGVSLSGDLYTVDEYTDKKTRAFAECRVMMMCYFLLASKNLEKVVSRLAEYEKGEVFCTEKIHTKEELSLYIKEKLPRIISLIPAVNRPAPAVKFPFAKTRSGQKDLVRRVWDAIKTRTSLAVSAPTGIGKTVAVLYPVLKAMEAGKVKKAVYISPKSTLKSQVAETVGLLQSEEKTLKTLVISAKMQICPQKCEICEPEKCRYASAFFSRLGDAVAEIMQNGVIGARELTEMGEKYTVCPFELSLYLTKLCEVIILDYNYIFDPACAIRSLFSRENILIADEAHNIPARVREAHSVSISPVDLDFFFSSETFVSKKIRPALVPLTAFFEAKRALYKTRKEYFSQELPEDLVRAAKEILPKLALIMSAGFGESETEDKKRLSELFRKLSYISFVSGIYGEDHRTLFFADGGVEIYLVSPESTIVAVKEKWRSCIFFSGTLLPENFWKRMLVPDERDSFFVIPSPFPRDNLFVGLCDIDVSYSQRFLSADAICRTVKAATSSKKGNYMVFLPSFEYLSFISQEYNRRYLTGDRVIVQKKNMTYAERRAFIEEFRKERNTSLIGFAVIGGVFSEGIDFLGEMLSGEIIIGTGFPPPSERAEAESDCYFKKELNGKDLAYTLPGFNRVLQASGRVIRSENDRGFVILCDKRYFTEEIKELFPSEWEDAEIMESTAVLSDKLKKFWR